MKHYHIQFILYLSTTKDKGGKEDALYVPDQLYQRIGKLWMLNIGNLIKSGADPKTVRKYLAQDGFSPAPPVKQTKPSILDPYKPVILEWLEEDKKQWHKQRHTAKRIFDRLTEEE